jgi:DNA-binding NarL/FixJ family response regulator
MTQLRLLVVDDHAVVRRGVRALLESQPGWEVCDEATNGEEAVRKAAELKPDIVVLDISLPELNGLEATSRILKESPESEVLILTMHHSEELAQQVIKAGARGYVLKSDADQSLIAAVDKLRQHQTFFTSRVAEFVLDSGLRGESTKHGVEDRSRRLTSRERQVVQLVAEARSTKEVASQLGISVKTVEAHRTNVMRKLHLHSVSELVRYAIRNGMVEP